MGYAPTPGHALRTLTPRKTGFRTDLGYSPLSGRILMSEDNELFQRMLRRGGQVLYVPDALVHHRVRPEAATLAYYRTWNIGYGRSSVRMKGRPGRLGIGLSVLAQLFRILRSSLSPVQWMFATRAVRIRKRYQAVGRILELLDISLEPEGDPSVGRREVNAGGVFGGQGRYVQGGASRQRPAPSGDGASWKRSRDREKGCSLCGMGGVGF